MNVLIVTCHHCYNAGASLQAYALQTYLRENGEHVETIDYLPDYLKHYKLFANVPARYSKPVIKQLFLLYYLPRRIVSRFDKSKRKYDQFKKHYLCLTKHYSSYSELLNNPPQADIYIAGSDQIWNTMLPNGHDPSFYLQFAPKGKKRISYAASFGVSKIADEYKNKLADWIKTFDFISVREETGLTILNDLNINYATQVVDPVFLLSSEQWRQISSPRLINKKYVLVIDYNRGMELREFAVKIAAKNNLEVVAYNPFDRDCFKGGPLDFLSLIYYSEAVVANSFHAVAFSVIFEKEFYVFGLKEWKTNSRLYDFVSSVGLSDRVVSNEKDQIVGKCDFSTVRTLLESKIRISKQFLSEIVEQ